MRNILLIALGKLIVSVSTVLRLGNGSTWPGHIVLFFNPHFIEDIRKESQTNIILIAGTNGKTTTGKFLTTILQRNGKKVFQNESGANLINGIASSFIMHTTLFGQLPADFAIFEVDENIFPLLVKKLDPFAIILLNLFRDQMDRYGEIDTIVTKWKTSLATLPKTTHLILNADDPQIAYLGKSLPTNTVYFGMEEKNFTQTVTEHASDSLYCPQCTHKLSYKKSMYSHLGNWYCSTCTLHRPTPTISSSPFYPLVGDYNKYNTLAALLASQIAGIPLTKSTPALRGIAPAFGRQEKLTVNGKTVQVFLSKNPTSFNQSLHTIVELHATTVLIVLNDRIPDGHDVSWIWDVDFEAYLTPFSTILISGDRAYDMALRVQYALGRDAYTKKAHVYPNLPDALREGIKHTTKQETFYILPTYSAMLEVRKFLTGKKIL